MNQTEVKRFNELYQRHLRLLKLQGKSQKTIDAYSRAVRRISEYFDCCPDQLTPEQLEIYFARLVESHSWSTGESSGESSGTPMISCVSYPVDVCYVIIYTKQSKTKYRNVVDAPVLPPAIPPTFFTRL